MTITQLSPTRRRLLEARAHRQAVNQRLVNDRPYRWEWFHNAGDGLWQLSVTVTATGQELRTTYSVPNAPDVVDAERAAARLYGYRRWEAGR